jgi:phage baseplate assembly protein W
MSEGFLGTGCPFPFLPDASGSLRYVSGEADITQCLLILLQTEVGERVMRPDFGTQAPGLVFAPGSSHYLRLLEQSITDAIRTFEPRVEVSSVLAEADSSDATKVTVSIAYQILRTNTKANLVFPYYLGVVGGGSP